jgi:hypothetical protein
VAEVCALKMSVVLEEMSEDTGLDPHDIAATLQRLDVVRKRPSDGK